MFAILRVCNATLIPNDYLSAALNQSKDLESSNSANNPDSLLSAEISEAETKQQNSGNMKRRDVSRGKPSSTTLFHPLFLEGKRRIKF